MFYLDILLKRWFLLIICSDLLLVSRVGHEGNKETNSLARMAAKLVDMEVWIEVVSAFIQAPLGNI